MMDLFDDDETSNKNKAVAIKPKSKNSQQLRRILNNKIGLCPK